MSSNPKWITYTSVLHPTEPELFDTIMSNIIMASYNNIKIDVHDIQIWGIRYSNIHEIDIHKYSKI